MFLIGSRKMKITSIKVGDDDSVALIGKSSSFVVNSAASFQTYCFLRDYGIW